MYLPAWGISPRGVRPPPSKHDLTWVSCSDALPRSASVVPHTGQLCQGRVGIIRVTEEDRDEINALGQVADHRADISRVAGDGQAT